MFELCNIVQNKKEDLLVGVKMQGLKNSFIYYKISCSIKITFS